MARPVSLVESVRLHLYGPDSTTSRGTLSADGASANHSKDLDGSALSFSASALEAVLASDPTLLDDSFAQPERFISGSWSAFGTPYALSPGGGTVHGLSGAQEAAPEQAPAGVGALQALLAECIVLPRDPDPDSVTFRYSGGIEQNRYLGWMSIGYDETGDGWNDADIYDPVGHPKEDKPPGWTGTTGGANWVFRDADEGGLTLFRFGTFTLAADTRVHILSSSDENHKVYLDGPNAGCCIIDFSGDEDAYNDEPGYWSRRLKAGTYRVSAEMRTVHSDGGDGNDSIRMEAWSFAGFDRQTPTVLLSSGAATRVHRQAVTDERPGFTVGKLIRYLLEDNDDLAVDAAALLLANASFTDDDDSSADPWPDGVEWVWPLGTTLATALSDVQEDADFDMGPGFTFDAWGDRGSDLSSSVGFIPGSTTPAATMNVEGETYESDPPGPNAYLALSNSGFDYREGTVPTGSRRRAGFLELGSAPSVGRARKLTDVAIRQGKTPRRFYRYQLMQVSGATFYTDVNLCDRVSGRDFTRTGAVQELTGFGWSVSGDTATFTAETGEV